MANLTILLTSAKNKKTFMMWDCFFIGFKYLKHICHIYKILLSDSQRLFVYFYSLVIVVCQTFERYVKGSCSMPLIVYGDSGCGKTSLVAMAARASWDWMEGYGALVYR